MPVGKLEAVSGISVREGANRFGQEFVTELKERFTSAGLYSVVATGDALIDVSSPP